MRKGSLLIFGALCTMLWTCPSSVLANEPAEQATTQNALSALTLQAKGGDVEAQVALAEVYQSGDGVVQDYTKAAFWFEQAVKTNHSDAQYGLATLRATGLGVDQDYDLAFALFEKSAKQNNALAQHSLALLHEKELSQNSRPEDAAHWYKNAAELGFSESQTNLGVLYQTGALLPQDYEKARELYLKAAIQNNQRAQNNLGILYTKALGVDQDYAQAAKWYRLAADNGLKTAMTNLGVLYENGFGVDQSDEEAKRWYRLGGQGQKHALNTDGLSEISAEDLKKRAEAGDAAAQYYLAIKYYQGDGLLQDYVLAYKWVNLAISRGQKDQNDIRTRLSDVMLPRQINQAQALTRAWTPTGKD